MANQERKEVEILVHTSAPSRGPDDARYRALARAFLNFQVATRVELQGDDKDEFGISNDEEDKQIQEEIQQPTQEYDFDASYRPPSQEDPESNKPAREDEVREELMDLMPSPQMSFESVLDNRDSPMFRTRHGTSWGPSSNSNKQRSHELTQSSTTRRLLIPESPIIEDSQPSNNLAEKEFSSPTRLLEVYYQNYLADDSTQESPVPPRLSQNTEESSLSLAFPHALGDSSSHPNSQSGSGINFGNSTPRHQNFSPPPRRVHAQRYRQISTSPLPDPNLLVDDTTISDVVFTPLSGLPAPLSNERVNRTIEMSSEPGSSGGGKDEELIAVEVPATQLGSRDIPSSSNGASDKDLSRAEVSRTQASPSEIPETSSSLPAHANTAQKRAKIDSPSATPQVTQRTKLVISDTTGETSSMTNNSSQLASTGHQQNQSASSTPPSSVIAAIASEVNPQSPSSESRVLYDDPWIRSWPPPTGNLKFSSDLFDTPAFITLREAFESRPKIYSPVYENYTVQAMFEGKRAIKWCDSGCWIIDTSSMDADLREKLWDYLYRFITKGEGYWGMSAFRAKDWNTIRVACFAHNIRDVWLLVYIGSCNRIRGKDAWWLAADEPAQVVISMNGNAFPDGGMYPTSSAQEIWRGTKHELSICGDIASPKK